jgi:hypothetical protein
VGGAVVGWGRGWGCSGVGAWAWAWAWGAAVRHDASAVGWWFALLHVHACRHGLRRWAGLVPVQTESYCYGVSCRLACCCLCCIMMVSAQPTCSAAQCTPVDGRAAVLRLCARLCCQGGMVATQDIPKTADRAPSRTFTTWRVDLAQASSRLGAEMYCAAGARLRSVLPAAALCCAVLCCAVLCASASAARQWAAGGLLCMSVASLALPAPLYGPAVCHATPVMCPSAAAAAGCGTRAHHGRGPMLAAQPACWPWVPKHRPLGMPPQQCRHLAACASQHPLPPPPAGKVRTRLLVEMERHAEVLEIVEAVRRTGTLSYNITDNQKRAIERIKRISQVLESSLLALDDMAAVFNDY